MDLMDTVGTQQRTSMAQIRRLFVAVGVVGEVNDVTYQVGYNVDFLLIKMNIINSLHQELCKPVLFLLQLWLDKNCFQIL